ncbi:juvenile hormone esterase-like [Euwallacea similis]|uniref:juvenile hormone esterase-like n=1 Tax=Euwallacea similis TaxID=1736056 RepID=UPI00344E60C3
MERKVIIKQGTLVGITGLNLNGEAFYKFLGIPYAKPPVGQLRFKAPEPPEPWEGVRDCTQDGTPNIMFSFTQELIGSEDCLYLNVHTQRLPSPGGQLRPVMVFFHGGAFTMGSGTQIMCDPKYLLTEDIVLVSMNYRLGVFGFLSMEDVSLGVPGNAGLKDQTQALKWVKENISQFNGDPDNVTIFGISAGGSSVHFHVVSTKSKGLFHKAIAQSGSVLNPWAWGQRNSLLLAEKLGHKVKSEKEALRVLMEASSKELFDASQMLPDCIIGAHQRRPFGPIIEKPNLTAFITEDPTNLLGSGRYNQVPFIQGFCSNEGLIYELSKFIYIPKNFEPNKHLVPWHLNHPHKVNSPGLKTLSQWEQTLVDLYYKDGVSKKAIHDHLGDICFTFGILDGLRLQLKAGHAHQYLYKFCYETPLIKKNRSVMGLDESFKGVNHGTDQNVLFPFHLPGMATELTKEDLEAIRKVVKIWVDFASTGVPHPDWEPTTPEDKDLNYFILSEELRMERNPFEERMIVWREFTEDVGVDLSVNES